MACVNFDFGTNWQHVVPFLQTAEMEHLLEVTHDKILENDQRIAMGDDCRVCDMDCECRYCEPYNYECSPSVNMCSNSAIYDMVINFTNDAIYNKDKRIPKTLLRYYNRIASDDMEDGTPFWDLRDRIEQLVGCDFKTTPTNLIHWIPFGTCHWYNKYVGMYLAQKVCPQIEWKLLETDAHTTVICKDGSKMFDILAYGWNYKRLRAHCLNLSRVETDPSLGAQEAIEMCMENVNVRYSTLAQRATQFDPYTFLPYIPSYYEHKNREIKS